MLKHFKAKLVGKKRMNHDTWLFRFEYEKGFNLDFKAGQYLIVHVPARNATHSVAGGPHDGGEIKRRLLSIVTTPNDRTHFELLLQLIPGGVISEYFKHLKIDEEVLFDGPAGMFVWHESFKNKVFVVTGTGIAPIISMIKAHILEGKKMHLFWGLKSFDHLYFFDELKKLHEENGNFEFLICLSRQEKLPDIREEEKFFVLKRIDRVLIEEIQNPKSKILNHDFYLCGGRDAVESVKNLLLEKDVPREQIRFEKF